MDFNEIYPDTVSSVSSACRVGDFNTLNKLIEEGKETCLHDNRGWKALHYAAFHGSTPGHLKCLEILLNIESSDINWRTFDGETPLLLACKNLSEIDTTQAILFLIKNRKIQVDIYDLSDGRNPIHYAVLAENKLVFDALLNKDSDLVEKSDDFDGKTLLHFVIENKLNDFIPELLPRINFRQNNEQRDDNQCTPLFWSLAIDNFQALRMIICHIQKEYGNDYLKYLINEHKCNLNITPLMMAATRQTEDIISVLKLLIVNGADPNIVTVHKLSRTEGCALHYAIENDSNKPLEYLLPKTDENLIISMGKTHNIFSILVQDDNFEGLKIIAKINPSDFVFPFKDYLSVNDVKVLKMISPSKYKYMDPLSFFLYRFGNYLDTTLPNDEELVSLIKKLKITNHRKQCKILNPIISLGRNEKLSRIDAVYREVVENSNLNRMDRRSILLFSDSLSLKTLIIIRSQFIWIEELNNAVEGLARNPYLFLDNRTVQSLLLSGLIYSYIYKCYASDVIRNIHEILSHIENLNPVLSMLDKAYENCAKVPTLKEIARISIRKGIQRVNTDKVIDLEKELKVILPNKLLIFLKCSESEFRRKGLIEEIWFLFTKTNIELMNYR